MKSEKVKSHLYLDIVNGYKRFRNRVKSMVEAERAPISYKPIALDGGYGWVVVFGSFLIHVFADGFVYSFGVMVDTLVTEFDASNTEVSGILSILTGLMLATGPVASAICNKIGCRLTTIIGAIIASIGCATSYYATSVPFLVGSVGIIMGTGFGLMYCPAIVIVTMYFEKYRSLATGVTVCGAGVGTMFFSLIVSHWIVAYGWRMVFLIYTGIVLLCVPCGLLYRPIQFQPIYAEDEEEKEKEKQKLTSEDETDEQAARELPSGEDGKLRAAVSHTAVNEDPSPKHDLKRHQSMEQGLATGKPVTESTGYLNVKDVFFQGSVTQLPEYQKEGEMFRSVSSLASVTKERHRSRTLSHAAASLKDVVEEEDSEATSAGRGVAIWRTVNKIIDLSLFADPVYFLFAVSNFLTSIGFNAPPMFMPVMGEKVLGLAKEEAAKTVFFYGAANIAGRIAFGLVCDRQLPFKGGKDTARNRLWIYNWALMITGTLSCLVYFMRTPFVFISYCFAFGFLISSYVCLTSVVLVDFIGVNRLTSAFGLLLLVQGIATFVGPPIAAWFYDITGYYDYTFGFCGVCLFISGIMLFAVPVIQRRRKGGDAIRLESNAPGAKVPLVH